MAIANYGVWNVKTVLKCFFFEVHDYSFKNYRGGSFRLSPSACPLQKKVPFYLCFYRWMVAFSLVMVKGFYCFILAFLPLVRHILCVKI